MDVTKELKRIHPQKYYFKIMCRLLFYMGLGDCWYEKSSVSLTKKIIYKAWIIVSNTYIFLIILDEFLAFIRSDLNDKEKRDLIQFSFGHPTMLFKVIAFCFSKSRVTVVLNRLLEGTRTVFTTIEADKACVKKFLAYCLAIFGGCFITIFTSTIDMIREHLKEGTPIRIEVTYYPSTQNGIFVSILRFFIELHWWYLVTIMVIIDCLALCSLLSLGCKFKALRIYFDGLRIKFLENLDRKSQKALEEDFKKDFVIGIQLHEDALCLFQAIGCSELIDWNTGEGTLCSREDVERKWCARNVQYALGNLYSIQVIEGVALIVMCLLRLVISERTMIFLLANLAYMACVILITGCYMMAAGDITHEAALLSTSIFHCGWELSRCRRDVGVLVLIALQRGQVPLHMTAFGVITLSYSNFISVLRSSYSFFAVMY